MSQRMYAESAEVIHLFTVKGKRNIFGAHNFWDVMNRRTEAKVKRLSKLPPSLELEPASFYIWVGTM